MGVRNILILFFSTMAVSLVILIVLFNLVFKNIDMTFETKVPESAPSIHYPGMSETRPTKPSPPESRSMPPENLPFKARDVMNATVRVPGHYSGREKPSTEPVDPETGEPSFQTDETDTEQEYTEPGSSPTQNAIDSSETSPPPGEPPKPKDRKENKSKETDNAAVRPRATETPPEKQPMLYQVYIDGFASEADAQAHVDRLRTTGVESFISTSGGRITVKLGTFSSRQSADAVAARNGGKVRVLD